MAFVPDNASSYCATRFPGLRLGIPRPDADTPAYTILASPSDPDFLAFKDTGQPRGANVEQGEAAFGALDCRRLENVLISVREAGRRQVQIRVTCPHPNA